MKVVTSDGDFELGTTETTPTIGLTDFSRRVTDDFGVTTIVERGFSRRMSVKLGLPFDTVDAVHRRLSDLRAAPALWVADDRFVWLSLYGFYKDFDVDLAVPPLSRVTLTIDGLAETGGVADNGADPALGQASTLQLLQPAPVTDAMLAASTVAENDAGEWAAGTGYGKGARVIRASTHRVYESLITGNVGRVPENEPAWWLDVGPTNRWAMFDQALGTATTRNGGVEVTLNGGTANAVSVIDLVGETVRVRANGYDQTQAVRPGAMTFTGLPGSGQVIVTVSGAQAAVGTLLIGRMVGLGVTEAAPTAGITDFSRKVTDDFGSVSVVQRGFSKRMTARALIRTDAVDVVADRMAAVRARPSLWIGQSGVDAITVYGFVKDFEIEVGTAVSKLSLTVEGLTKAAPVAEGVVQLVPRGPYDAATIYARGALVEDQGVTWRYINATPSSGYAPPTLPTTSNAFWQVFSSVGMTPEQEQALSGAVERVAALGSDNVLSSGSEKQTAIIDWNTLYQDLESLYAKYVELGSPADLATPYSDASAARTVLGTYLGNLNPPWNQISTDTPVVSAEWSSKWTNAYQRINDLRAKIGGRKGEPGAGAFTLVGNLNVEVRGNTIRKIAGGDEWNAAAYSVEGLSAGAYIAVTAPTNPAAIIIGLSVTPKATVSYEDPITAWYFRADGTIDIVQSGVSLTNDQGFGIYFPGARYSIEIQNGVARYVGANGVLISAQPIDSNRTFYVDSSFRTPGGEIGGITFGSLAKDGASAPLVRTQWSINGVSDWHDNYMGADVYQRQSNDSGLTWGPAYKVIGEDGTIGADGTSPSVVFKRSATIPLAPADNSGNPPSGWTDGPPAGTDFLWQSKATFRQATQVTSWSAPVRISGEDGFIVDTETANFVQPVFSGGASKPSWTGASGTIRLTKGGARITAGVTYAVYGATNIAGLALSGDTFSFAGTNADAGSFTIRASYNGQNYDRVISIKKVFDGEAAFRGSTAFTAQQASGGVTGLGNGTTTVPGGRGCTLSAFVNYSPINTAVGSFRGRLYLYWRNATDNGPLNLLGFQDGSVASTTNQGTVAEPDYVFTPGTVSASFNFAAPSADKAIYFEARLERISGNYTVNIDGSMKLEVSS